MLKEEISKSEIKKIVDDEVKKTLKDELGKQLISSLKGGKGKDEINAAIKDALNNLYKFMYVKRSTWNNEIK